MKDIFKRNEIIFAASFIVIFFITFVLLYFIGLIPKEFLSSSNDVPTITETFQSNSLKTLGLEENPNTPIQSSIHNSPKVFAEDPVRIEAKSVGINSVILNPTSTDYRTLDNALVNGAVHYPGSGSVEDGNMFIIGHSTGFKLVNNKAYQVFNNIHSFKNGDDINILTAHKKYTYKVTSVRLVDGREELVDFKNTSRMLTLSTCNSFGQKTDRYLVQAVFDHSIDI